MCWLCHGCVLVVSWLCLGCVLLCLSKSVLVKEIKVCYVCAICVLCVCCVCYVCALCVLFVCVICVCYVCVLCVCYTRHGLFHSLLVFMLFSPLSIPKVLASFNVRLGSKKA